MDSERGGPCSVCGAAATSSCARCHFRRYCGRDCQQLDWKDGGHRKHCKVLAKRQDLRYLEYAHAAVAKGFMPDSEGMDRMEAEVEQSADRAWVRQLQDYVMCVEDGASPLPPPMLPKDERKAYGRMLSKRPTIASVLAQSATARQALFWRKAQAEKWDEGVREAALRAANANEARVARIGATIGVSDLAVLLPRLAPPHRQRVALRMGVPVGDAMRLLDEIVEFFLPDFIPERIDAAVRDFTNDAPDATVINGASKFFRSALHLLSLGSDELVWLVHKTEPVGGRLMPGMATYALDISRFATFDGAGGMVPISKRCARAVAAIHAAIAHASLPVASAIVQLAGGQSDPDLGEAPLGGRGCFNDTVGRTLRLDMLAEHERSAAGQRMRASAERDLERATASAAAFAAATGCASRMEALALPEDDPRHQAAARDLDATMKQIHETMASATGAKGDEQATKGGEQATKTSGPQRVTTSFKARGAENHFTICDTCGARGDKLVVCGHCRAVAYCGKDCQHRGWKSPEGGHKALCKALTARPLTETQCDHLQSEAFRKKTIGDPLTVRRISDAAIAGMRLRANAWDADPKGECERSTSVAGPELDGFFRHFELAQFLSDPTLGRRPEESIAYFCKSIEAAEKSMAAARRAKSKRAKNEYWEFRERCIGLIASARADMALALKRQGDIDGAIAEYRKACELDPSDALTLVNLSIALWAPRPGDLSKQDQKGGIDAARRATQADPNDPSAWYHFGLSLCPLPQDYLGSGIQVSRNVEEALKALRRATVLAEQPTSTSHKPRWRQPEQSTSTSASKPRDIITACRALGQIGTLLSNMKHDEEGAEAAYRRSLNISETPNVLANLGNLLAERKDWDAAITVLKAATRAQPAFAQAWMTLSSCYANKGDAAKAMEANRRANFL